MLLDDLDGRPSLRQVLVAAAKACGVDRNEIMGRLRAPGITMARAVYAAKGHELGYSYPEISRGMGRRTHTTVFCAARRFAAMSEPVRRDAERRFVEALKC